VTDETRARFLAAIVAQLPAAHIVEVHLFPAIRQGGMESGVAVIAVERAEPAPDAMATTSEDVAQDDAVPAADEESPYIDAAEAIAEAEVGEGEADAYVAPAATAPRRYTVYSARYRHTLKGPDRGKWEVSVTEEADAPLLTVDAVVRGVQRRTGEVDEIVRLSGDEVRGGVSRGQTP
jgi:hypothetical protein